MEATIGRTEFNALVNPIFPCLEIGPYARPSFRKDTHNVFYADILTSEQIKATCTQHGYNPAGTPDKIDILINPVDAPAIKTDIKFHSVYTSHNIEHQVNLLRHLREIADITVPEGKFYLAIPDKRYCFDHFQNESSIAEIIAADLEDRRKHTAQTILQTIIYETHNNEGAHWQGQHGPDQWTETDGTEIVARVQDAMRKIEENKTGYFDCHAWRFTPYSFFRNIMLTCLLNLQPWSVTNIWFTRPGTNEFYAILEKK